jgi:hypothetical protein
VRETLMRLDMNGVCRPPLVSPPPARPPRVGLHLGGQLRAADSRLSCEARDSDTGPEARQATVAVFLLLLLLRARPHALGRLRQALARLLPRALCAFRVALFALLARLVLLAGRVLLEFLGRLSNPPALSW